MKFTKSLWATPPVPRALPFAGWSLRLLLVIVLLPLAASADSTAFVLTGLATNPPHEEKFTRWTEETRTILVEDFGFDPSRVIVHAGRESTQDNIRGAFERARQQVGPGDTFIFILIGHGSFDVDYKLNTSGPDFTGAEYAAMLATVNAGRTIVVNSTSHSGAAIEAFAGRNRVVVTATRSGREGNDTVFYEHFLEALRTPEQSDEDKDGKVSIWEAARYAQAGIERFFAATPGRVITEHALISDNGGPGAAIAVQPGAVQEIPPLARVAVLNADRPVVVSDPRLQALLDERRVIQQEIETLQLNRTSIAAADYERRMDDLLIRLARKAEEIRQQEAGQ